ncbi:MAG: hypothetical protein KJ623_03460 [Nanoarchaeota archaeon]|nr:hypothetical protein [Nanoarchaeota archaeon]MBU0962747.1 hypothetical protein [Nanoarchaeota archaeon]
MIAEISNPSLGVGGEIADAAKLGKPVLCVYNKKVGDNVSAYIRGKSGSIFSPTVKCEDYSNLKELKSKIDNFIKNHPAKKNIIKVVGAMVDKNKALLIVRKADSDI